GSSCSACTSSSCRSAPPRGTFSWPESTRRRSAWWTRRVRADEPSLTARGVALARARLERSASPTGDPESDVALATSLAEGVERPVDLAERERRALRRFLSFMEARTLFFDDAVVGAIDRGVNQVVILGAGYDGRALRFRTPAVRFFEVDHPATQADKRRRLDALDIATTGITFVDGDFTEPRLDQRPPPGAQL